MNSKKYQRIYQKGYAAEKRVALKQKRPYQKASFDLSSANEPVGIFSSIFSRLFS